MNRHTSAIAVMSGLLLTGAPLSVEAKGNCDAQGGLYYLGNTRDDARSIWLSATSSGSFRLDAAQGNTTVDQWTKSQRGLNITASPFVSQGNGGVHKLFDTGGNKDCLIDSQNQKGGIQIPPHIVLPGGVKPPIGTLPPQRPPQGITPGLPGGVTPPIGTVPQRPPQGITPGLPIGVTPPIGTLPPQRPPEGITPGLPIGVTPPIGTVPPQRPPEGITPGLPTGVTPPIGTLPPQRPPEGITPTVPPISLPSQPTGTPPAPPPKITPVPPSAVDPLPSGTQRPPDSRQFLDCPDPRTRTTLPPGTPIPPGCDDQKPQCWPGNCQAGTEGLQQVPITPGRDLGVGVSKDWNLWTDATFVNVADGRYGLDVTGWSRVGTAGLDRKITNNFVLGLSVSLEDSMTGGYGGFFSASTRGISFGPYAALILSDNWAVDASLTYGRLSNNLSIAMLQSSFLSQRLSAYLNLHALYDLGPANVRPRLSD